MSLRSPTPLKSPFSLLLSALLGASLLISGCAPQNQSASSPAPEVAPTLETTTTVIEPLQDEPADPPFDYEPDFQRVSLADCATFPEGVSTWSERGDRIVSTGKPRGYLYTRDSFQNFTLRCDYRFPRPADLADESTFKGNTGFLIYITGPAKIWPLCLEVQGKHAEMAAIKENGGAEAPTVTDDPAQRLAARSPVGEWNSLEIVSLDGALTVTLNGVEVSSSEPNFLSSGSIGIQAEDHPFEIRRLRVRRDTP